jgi:spermidine dehydrogenase
MKKNKQITRRDFINGVALSLAAGTTLSPMEILARSAGRGSHNYPPALTGMRGSHDGSFEVAHALARAGKKFSRPQKQTESTYDLIVVGGGISGLSAAKFFRDRGDGRSKILVLDNHDDFGGHSRRNEFDVDGKKLLCYGGSQSIDNPAKWSKVARQLLRDLSIDTQRFYDYYDQEYFSGRGLRNGIYFDRPTYGVDRVLVNPIPGFLGESLSGDELKSVVRNLEGMSTEEKITLLRNTSYLEFLEKYAGMPESVTAILQDTFLVMNSVGWEADSAHNAASYFFPGTWELGVQEDHEEEEPYIFPGNTMEDVVTARADYSLLDRPDFDTRIRLNCTVVNAVNTPDGKHVDITYVNKGEIHRVRARHAVLACDNKMIPHICPELPARQAEAIQYASKIPFVVGSFAIRNWQWFSPTTRGLPARDQYRVGRAKLMEMSYDDFEQDIYAHLDGMLGPYGFDPEREIAAITLNRWPHGYAYEYEGVGIPGEYDRYHGPHIAGRAQIGRISIANADSEAYAYLDGSIDAADRAVNEQI